jgi:hypothetical protein
VTKSSDIMDIEANYAVFSSASAVGGIAISDMPADLGRESFIAMDPPRRSKTGGAPIFTPTHLDQLAISIRKALGREPR